MIATKDGIPSRDNQIMIEFSAQFFLFNMFFVPSVSGPTLLGIFYNFQFSCLDLPFVKFCLCLLQTLLIFSKAILVCVDFGSNLSPFFVRVCT